ncbi:MAG TPA: hypothetical protein VGH33_15525 [Isosphaeraceae bacterium]
MRSRPAVLALALGVVALLPGCHAGGASGLSAKPAPAVPGVSLTATEAIERHNLNAARVQVLEAQPQITVSAPGINGASAHGRMALERPRSFKLDVSATVKGKIADIGSNDQEFWFWAQSKKDNSIYVCSYDEIDRSPLSAAFQPDWIVEAMGLRTITREEARQMTSKGADVPGAVKLVSTRKGANGETLTKETILDTSGRIKEHRLYQGQGRDRTLLASATVTEFKPVKTDDGESVMLPYHFRLDWIPEKLTLDIILDKPTLLASYSDDTRQTRFAEPEIRGSSRVNLAELAPRQAPSASTRQADPAAPRTRQSRGAPSSRDSGVRLGAPEPFGVDDSARAPADPVALTADLSSSDMSDSGPIRPVRPALPRAVDQ